MTYWYDTLGAEWGIKIEEIQLFSNSIVQCCWITTFQGKYRQKSYVMKGTRDYLHVAWHNVQIVCVSCGCLYNCIKWYTYFIVFRILKYMHMHANIVRTYYMNVLLYSTSSADPFQKTDPGNVEKITWLIFHDRSNKLVSVFQCCLVCNHVRQDTTRGHPSNTDKKWNTLYPIIFLQTTCVKLKQHGSVFEKFDLSKKQPFWNTQPQQRWSHLRILELWSLRRDGPEWQILQGPPVNWYNSVVIPMDSKTCHKTRS